MTTNPESTASTEDQPDPYVLDNMVWYCVKAMLTPIWDNVKDTAPVTAFNWGPTLQALQEKEGRLPVATADVHDLVKAQAMRMALEHRIQQRLAKEEKERAARALERERQAQADAEATGEFTLD